MLETAAKIDGTSEPVTIHAYSQQFTSARPLRMLAEIRRLLKRDMRPAVFKAMVAALVAHQKSPGRVPGGV